MARQSPLDLRQRVTDAAEAVLARLGSVGPLELLEQLGFLHPTHVLQWRKGNPQLTPLEPHIQCGPRKLEATYDLFAEWVRARGLEPFEAGYTCAGAHGPEPLQVSDDPERQRFFSTHYAPAGLSAAETEKLESAVGKPGDLVVFQLTSPASTCSRCGAELFKGNLLFMEKGQPLCLACADLDHLEFLPSGDAALTRRARKYSPVWAVVVRFSRARKRYERQGILASPEAIQRAEQELAAAKSTRNG